jgi:hypothetical protein
MRGVDGSAAEEQPTWCLLRAYPTVGGAGIEVFFLAFAANDTVRDSAA